MHLLVLINRWTENEILDHAGNRIDRKNNDRNDRGPDIYVCL